MKKRHGFFGVLCLAVAGELLFFWKIAPQAALSKIHIISDIGLSSQEILALSGLEHGGFYFAVNEQILKERLEKHPSISTVRAEKKWPNSLTINIQGRHAAAAYIDGQGQAMFLDETGRIFSAMNRQAAFPALLRNLNVVNEKGYAHAERGIEGLLSDLARFQREKNELYKLISEISIVNNAGGDNFNAAVGFIHMPYTALFGNRISLRKLQRAVLVLTLLQQAGFNKASVLDFRTDQIVYKEGI